MTGARKRMAASSRLTALMGKELRRWRAGWPVSQDVIFVRRRRALADLLAGLPQNLDELGKAWSRGGAYALCVPRPGPGAAVENLPASAWTAILDRRERGACIQLVDCDATFPDLATFIADLKAELALGEETESTASIFMARAARGFPRHRDSKDVWIIGLAGRKTVRTAPAASVGPDHRDSIDDPPVPMPADAQVHVLARGDVLYIPRGCWHATHAETADTFSVSIGLTRPWRAEVMVDELLEVLSRDARWRRPITHCDEVIPVELIHELAESLMQRSWRSGAAASTSSEAYLRNRSAKLSVVKGQLRVESCGEVTSLRVTSQIDLAAFAAFVRSRETLTTRVVEARFPGLDKRACTALLALLYQAGFLRKAS